MPGPPPNPNAIRRNPRQGLTVLPSEGRHGRSPKWPLPDNPALTARIDMLLEAIDELEQREIDEGKLARADATRLSRTRERLAIARKELEVIQSTEKELWRELWRTPQSVEWERLKWTREVAQYVRWKAMAETGSLDAGKESRMYADRLGLTPKGMRGLMWVVSTDELANRRPKPAAATGTDGAAPRRRLRAVDKPAED
jgi:hypothetical protein